MQVNIFFYDDDKQVIAQYLVSPQEGIYGIHIPTGQWHTLEVKESGTVIFEVKDGPYTPLRPDDVLL